MENEKMNEAAKSDVLKIVGVGGAGLRAINKLKESRRINAEFIAVDSDEEALGLCAADKKIPVAALHENGELITMEFLKSRREIADALRGADAVFILAGLGCTFGSEFAAEVAGIASELGALCVATPYLPFAFEGAEKNKRAADALVNLKEHADVVIAIPNESAKNVRGRMSLTEAFEILDSKISDIIFTFSEMMSTVELKGPQGVWYRSGFASFGKGTSLGKTEYGIRKAVKEAESQASMTIPVENAKSAAVVVYYSKSEEKLDGSLVQAELESIDAFSDKLKNASISVWAGCESDKVSEEIEVYILVGNYDCDVTDKIVQRDLKPVDKKDDGTFSEDEINAYLRKLGLLVD